MRENCLFSPDGTLIIVSGSEDKTFQMWDARSGVNEEEYLPLSGHLGHISSGFFA